MVARVVSLAVVLSVMQFVCYLGSARGAEVEGAEPAESAVSSPPMEMDDPGTPGARGIEVNLVGNMFRIGPGRESETLFDANYGIGDRLQLKYERPYLTQGGNGEPFQEGLGATELGVKWRFLERHGFEVAFYPQYEFDDAYTVLDEAGVPEESAGSSFYAPLLMSKHVGQLYTVGANVGYRRNLEDRGDDINLAIGAGRAIFETTRLLAEVFSERDEHLNNRQTDVRLGAYGTLFGKWFEKSAFELDEYVSVGHSVGATEARESSTSFTFGVSMIRKPKGE